MPDLNLTPFGFTPTESLAYGALLSLGYASGYAVAKEIGVARANAYQALNGLVSKSAAILIEDAPQLFRAVKPEALLAAVADAEAEKLARLERQIEDRGGLGADAIVPITGERGLREVLTRWAGRTSGEILLLAPRRLIDALQPVLRKREADGSRSSLYATDELPAATEPVPADLVLFWCDGSAVVASLEGGGSGHWFSSATVRATVRSAILGITQPVG